MASKSEQERIDCGALQLLTVEIEIHGGAWSGKPLTISDCADVLRRLADGLNALASERKAKGDDGRLYPTDSRALYDLARDARVGTWNVRGMPRKR